MRVVLCLCLLLACGLPFHNTQAQAPDTLLISTQDGLLSMRVPADWYITANPEEASLIAAPTPEDATDELPSMRFHISEGEFADSESAYDDLLKDLNLAALDFEASASLWQGLDALHYVGSGEGMQAHIWIAALPEASGWLRLAVLGQDWDEALFTAILDSVLILPQRSAPPRGWPSSVRAPSGWQSDDFSSFARWTAADDSSFAGTEIWFQAGYRADLIGQGDIRFVLQTLGVSYATQADTSQTAAVLMAGLAAQTFPFESFTHTGVAVSVEAGQNFGTANLVMRAPLGTWAPAHDRLLEAVIAGVQVTPPTADAAPVGLRTGYRAPAFSGQLADGTPFSSEMFEGQLVLVHFWFVDCPYCRAEWPHMQAVYDEYRERGMVLLGINAIDPPAYIQSYLESANLDFSLVLDNGTLHQQFNVRAFPTTYVIAPDGVLVSVAQGPLSERSLRNLAEQYLGQ